MNIDIGAYVVPPDPEIQRLLALVAEGNLRAELRLVMLKHTETCARVRARALARQADDDTMHRACLDQRRRAGDPELRK